MRTLVKYDNDSNIAKDELKTLKLMLREAQWINITHLDVDIMSIEELAIPPSLCEHDGEIIVVGKDDDEIVGFTLLHTDDMVTTIYQTFVDSKHRRNGWGRKMVEFIREHIATGEVEAMWETNNAPACKFWEMMKVKRFIER